MDAMARADGVGSIARRSRARERERACGVFARCAIRSFGSRFARAWNRARVRWF